MGDILGFIGTIASAAIQSKAVQKAQEKQLAAIEQARQFVYSELDPKKVGSQAYNADVENAKRRLALQAEIDPELAAARKEASARLRKIAGEDAAGAEVSSQAVKEALAGGDVAGQAKQKLIDAALHELELGATLPNDVQAELVKAGLERGAMTTGSASGGGFGTNITRNLVGSAALQLQQQRQQSAAALLGQAQNIEQSRASILGNLFPNLAAQQLNRLGAQAGVLNTTNAIMPSAGLTGSDVKNLWLARVGSNAALGVQAGNVAGQGAMAQGNIWGGATGAIAGQAQGTLPTSVDLYKQWTTPSTKAATPPPTGDVYGGF